MKVGIRKSTPDDVDFLVKLEAASFPAFQRSSDRSIKRGVFSPFQEIIIAETDDLPKVSVGALVLFKYPKSLRIYSIAIAQEHRNMGYGDELIKYVFEMASHRPYEKVLAEVSASNSKLVDWYVTRGYVKIATLPNYYCLGEDAIKMEYITSADRSK